MTRVAAATLGASHLPLVPVWLPGRDAEWQAWPATSPGADSPFLAVARPMSAGLLRTPAVAVLLRALGARQKDATLPGTGPAAGG